MKGYATDKRRLRRRVFEEIARLGYEGAGPEAIDQLPFKIVPLNDEPFRDTIFLERAVVGERLRAAMGLPLRPIDTYVPASAGVDESMIADTYYEPPLLDIIKVACNRCPDNRFFVTNGCQGCLEHPCMEVCPKKCISMKDGRSFIDQDACIKCERCLKACPYNAIIHQKRPCVQACGIGAIHENQYGHAEIDQEKCVSCGMCLDSCPFAAIVDKGQIYQTVRALESDTDVYAIVAPAIAGQFGKSFTDTKMKEAFGILGFKDVMEVAVGADLCTIQEAGHFLKDVPENIPFMGTSCCPAWSIFAKKEFPEYANTISMALTPMVLTARLVKKKHPDCKIAFIGPCLSKKNEASRKSVKSFVDFTLTFEELAGMFTAKGLNFDEMTEKEPLRKASRDGYGFARSGGVAQAVANHIEKTHPEIEVKIAKAEGLAECKKMMLLASKGKYDGYLIEGMACPGGCIGGAGTLVPMNKADHQLSVSQNEAGVTNAIESRYADWLPTVENLDKEFEYSEEE